MKATRVAGTKVVKQLLPNFIRNETLRPICFDRNLNKTEGGRMKSSGNTARQLIGLTLTLVGLLSWNPSARHGI
jgi:hypothetical protein